MAGDLRDWKAPLVLGLRWAAHDWLPGVQRPSCKRASKGHSAGATDSKAAAVAVCLLCDSLSIRFGQRPCKEACAAPAY